jgi:hypothetical protein
LEPSPLGFWRKAFPDAPNELSLLPSHGDGLFGQSGVFISYQVKDSVHQEQIQLLIQVNSCMLCLPCRRFRTDHDIAHASRMQRSSSPFPLCESQYVGRSITGQVLSVQLLHPPIAHEHNREFRFLKA